MTKITQGARFIHKYSNEVGVIPTIPPNNDHTMDWFPTDIYKGEFYMNIADDRLFTRTDNGIIEIPMSVDLDIFANGTSVTITNTVGDDAIIGGATPTQAGLVTNDAQSWNGEKTFNANIIANQHIRGSFGTVGSPTYSFNGATTTGMFRPSPNTLGFSVNGVEKIRISPLSSSGIRLGDSHVTNLNNETVVISKISTDTTGLDGAFLRLHNTSTSDNEGITSGIKFMVSSPTVIGDSAKGAIFFRKNVTAPNNRGDLHFALNTSNNRTTEVSLSDTKMILYDSGNLEVMNDMIVGNDLSVNNDIEVGGSGYFTGAIKIGNTSETDNGIIRYTGTDVEARIGGDWISLSQGGAGNVDLDVLTGTTTLTILNSGGDDAVLSGATTTEAGLVTTEDQTWVGIKTFSDVIRGINGTESDPTYSFSNATSTGMFRSSVNSLGLSANGTERIKISSGGLVRLGNVDVTQLNNETVYVTKSSTNTTGSDGSFLTVHNTNTSISVGTTSGIKFRHGSPTTLNYSAKGAIFFRKAFTESGGRGEFVFALNDDANWTSEALLADAKMTLRNNGDLDVNGGLNASNYSVGGIAGLDGVYGFLDENGDPIKVTITKGIITDIQPII